MILVLQSYVRRAGILALAAFCLASSNVRAAGEVGGRLAGYVYDPTGSPLSDVPMTLTSPSLMQPQTRTSDAQGKFEFNQLPPGDAYALEVNVPGFNPVKKGGITLNVGQTTPVDIHLALMTETENTAATYEIVEKVNPALNPDSAQSSAVITHEKAEITPVFHQVQAMASQVAGVGPGSTPSTLGGFGRFGKYYVDGMDTTDITDGSFTAPMNFDVVENFEIITGGFDAQYNALGLVQNIVTKNGSNKFTYDVNLTWSPPAFNASTKVQTGVPDINQELTNNNGASPQTSFFSPVFNVGGPIVENKLWFYASGQLNRSIRQTLITNAYESDNRQTTTWTDLARLKLTWQASSKDLVSVAVNFDANRIYNSAGSVQVTPSAEQRIKRGGYFLMLNYNHNFSDNLLFQIQAGTTNREVDFNPEVDGISHTDILNNRVTTGSAGSLSFGNQGNFIHEQKSRFQFDPTLSWNLGAHQIKGGIQTSFLLDTQINGVTGTVRYTDKNGICDPTSPATSGSCYQRSDFYNSSGDAAPQKNTANAYNVGAFLQDRWSVTRQLTLIAGMRVDTGLLYGNTGYLTTLTGIGPRLSATYDVTGDRKKLVTLHYGRSNDVGNVFIAQFVNPALTQVTSTYVNGAFTPCAIGSLNPNCSTSGGARQITQNPLPPHLDEVSAGYRQEVATQTVIGVDGAYRKYSNLWAAQEVNRVFDYSGTRIIGFENGQALSVLRAVKPDSAQREYAGGNLWIQGSPPHWDLLASYTLGFARGTVDDYFDGYLSNPRYSSFYEGFVNDDRRHTLKGSIAYTTDIGLDFGFRFQYRTGSPLWETFSNPADPALNAYRSPRGTGFSNTSGRPQDFNDPSTFVSLRNPDQFNVDLQARYNLGKALGMGSNRVELALFVFNALNNVSATGFTGQFSQRNSSFGYTSSRGTPAQLELFLRVRNF